MSFSNKLTAQTIHSVDTQGMATNIAEMGSHIREAIELTRPVLAGARLPEKESIHSIVIAGIGGSAIGGDLVKSYTLDSLSVPLYISRSYTLPAFANANTLVVVSSYSGNTEESISMYEEARERKVPTVCITTGGSIGHSAAKAGLLILPQRAGFQPRAALAFSFVPLLLLLDAMGFLTGQREVLEAAARHLDNLAAQYSLENAGESNAAFHLASQLMHRIPVVYSAGDVLEAVNLRWRGQLQENAKHLAFGSVLPEMNHNEINGWSHPLDLLQHLLVILLRSKQDEHPRVSKRFEVMHELLAGRGMPIVEIEAEGESRLERMFSLISLADWTSLYLALLGGVDPTPIPMIDHLKQKMG